MRKLICPNCGIIFETNSGVKKFCCKDCQEIYESKIKYKDIEGYVECKECGMIGETLLKHISAKHGSIEEYCKKHNCKKEDLISESYHKKLSNAQKKLIKEGRSHCFTSENNPSKGEECKNGRNSPYSMNFRGYDGLSNEEKQEKINKLYVLKIESTNKNCNNPLTLEYYIKRGYSKSKAEEMLKDRQSTFSLEKCIEKYGEKEGKEKFSQRQEKWQKNYKKNNFSKISQDLFWKLYEKIKNDYQNIRFATIHPEKQIKMDDGINYEDVIKLSSTSIKPDFYIPSINKIIEFDGDYWHGKERGNKLRDKERDNLLSENGYLIYHVKERDYNENPEKVIQECVEFIKS